MSDSTQFPPFPQIPPSIRPPDNEDRSLPIPGLDPKTVSAWLYDQERAGWQALHCPDLETEFTVRIRLHEDQKAKEAGRRPSRKRLTPEQEQRLSDAQKLLEARVIAYDNIDYLLHWLASTRRNETTLRTILNELKTEFERRGALNAVLLQRLLYFEAHLPEDVKDEAVARFPFPTDPEGQDD